MYSNIFRNFFKEETFSIMFALVFISILVFSIFSFFSQKSKNPQITDVAAQTQANVPEQNGAYEPVRTYTVKPGDSLSLIAQRLYGSTDYWPLISMENRIEDVNKILIGDVLDLPSKEVLDDFTRKTRPGQILTGASIEALTDTMYKVQKGDTLWYICERRYGDPRKYADVAKINKLINPDHIEPDWQLSLPDL